jgi:FKBP-type peptidyl-prolyl cis-trans isomerase FkpA
MFKFTLLFLFALIATTTFAAESPINEEQKVLLALGESISRSITVFDLTPSELDVVVQGLKNAQSGKGTLDQATYAPKIQEFARARRKKLSEKLVPAYKEYLKKAQQEKGAVTSNSGLVYIPLREGAGASPAATDMVTVNYRGTLIDGREFDSSYKRGKSAEFKLSAVIPCWTEGVQKMKVGGKARLVCPSTIAYGDNGAGEMILPGATLDFEVELIDIKK